ncbi:MAG: Polysaccharide biosynthesis protein [Candidatus Hydrogenedentota bacterium]|jgi:O-antigen/teichoic acid export membrane protein
MSRSRRYLRGAAWSAASTAVALASLLAVAKMATNALSTETVGLFMLAMMLGDGFNLLANRGLFASAPKLMAASPDDQTRRLLLGSLLLGLSCSSAVVSILILGAALAAEPLAAMAGVDAPSLRICLLWSLPLFVLGNYRDTLLGAFAGWNRYAAHALGSMCFSGGQALLVFLLVWLGEASLPRLLLAVTLAQAGGVALLVGLTGGLSVSNGLAAYRDAARFSLPLYLNSLLNFAFQRMDTLLVTAMLGLHATAIYEIAKRFPQVLSRVLNALLLPWLPSVSEVLAEGRHRDAAVALRDVLCVITYLGHLAVLTTLPLGPLLVRMIASPEYLDSAAPLPWLMLGILFAVQAGVFGQALIAVERPRAVFAGHLVQAAINLAGALALLPSIGLLGMGYAWCVGSATSLLLQGFAARRARLNTPLGLWCLLHGLCGGGWWMESFTPGLGLALYGLAGGIAMYPLGSRRLLR